MLYGKTKLGTGTLAPGYKRELSHWHDDGSLRVRDNIDDVGGYWVDSSEPGGDCWDSRLDGLQASPLRSVT